MSAAADLTAASWKQFSCLLDRALELPVAERAAWIEALGPEDDALKPALRAVLLRQSGAETAQWLQTLPHTASAPIADESDLQPGVLVGPYRLIRELGIGGMGAVWLAERADGTLKRQVALKLPRAIWSPGLAQRMARERDILAALEHPHIARLYDAGTDAQGRPFLALEYVEGQPIDVYCRERGLSIKQRVQLLLQVAHAVAFAHSRLVVHRDLKPSNILVTADGQVRLLDFGIAKLMEGDRAAETQLTQIAGRALTLDYASPEQIRGEPIGTASDVYSLGVVAYELLTGSKPYRLKRGSAAELEEAIAAMDAPLASASTTDAAVRRELRGDLDAILNKALKKISAERYATVDALAQDLERHARGERVAARPDSFAYLASRFARRHRVPLAAVMLAIIAFGLAIGAGATAVVILALLIGLAAAMWQAREARRQAEIARERTRIARTEAKTAEAVQNFLEGIFRSNTGDQADPLRARQRTAKELLDEAAVRIDKELDDSPAVKFRVLKTLASMYDDMGELERVVALRAVRADVAARAYPGATAERAQALAELAESLSDYGRDVEAWEKLKEAEAIVRARPHIDDDAHIAVDMALANYYRLRADVRGVAAARRAIERLMRRPPSQELLGALYLLGILERAAGNAEHSAQKLREALAIASQLPGRSASVVPSIRLELAMSEQAMGQTSAAEANLREAVRLAESNAGPTSLNSITLLSRLGQLLTEAGRPREALEVLHEVRQRLSRCPDSPDKIARNGPKLLIEAIAYRCVGYPERAMSTLDEALAIGPRLEHDPAIGIWVGLTRADALIDLGRFDEAREALAQGEAVRERHDLTSYRISEAFVQVGVRLRLAAGDVDDAVGQWQRFVAEPETQPHRSDPSVLALESEITLAGNGAAPAVEAARRGLETLRTRAPEDRVSRYRLHITLARALLELQLADDAIPSLQEALQLNESMCDCQFSPDRVLALALWAQAQLALGNCDEAALAAAQAQTIVSRHGHLGPQYMQPLATVQGQLSKSLQRPD